MRYFGLIDETNDMEALDRFLGFLVALSVFHHCHVRVDCHARVFGALILFREARHDSHLSSRVRHPDVVLWWNEDSNQEERMNDETNEVVSRVQRSPM